MSTLLIACLPLCQSVCLSASISVTEAHKDGGMTRKVDDHRVLVTSTCASVVTSRAVEQEECLAIRRLAEPGKTRHPTPPSLSLCDSLSPFVDSSLSPIGSQLNIKFNKASAMPSPRAILFIASSELQ